MLSIAPDVVQNGLINGHGLKAGSPDSAVASSQHEADAARNIIELRCTDQIRELHTVLRDVKTSRSDFIFYADRLIRLVVEEGLNLLPYEKITVTTPSGKPYEGLRYMPGNCGVSIMRSGEAMEAGLRDCCRSIRIGKILIQVDEEHDLPVVYYSKLPQDVSNRKVLLLYPVIRSGKTVSKALEVLSTAGVREEDVILLSLFCTSQAAKHMHELHSEVRVVTSQIHPIAPSHFCEKYFGTE